MKGVFSLCEGSQRRGSTLIAVFWLMSILGLALFATVTLVKFESDLAASQTGGTRAAHFAEMGIAVGANPVVERDDPLLRQTFEGGFAGFHCEIESEADKIDINLLLLNQNELVDDKGWLENVFNDWGMELEDARALVAALVDWVDEGDLAELNGAESPYYEGQGFSNRPFDRPFYSLAEMRFVRGMDLLEQVNPNWQDFFTIWTQSGIDVNDASAEMLSLVLDVPFEDGARVVEAVAGADGIRGTEDDELFQSAEEAFGPNGLVFLDEEEFSLVGHRITANSPTVRIQSVGWSGDVKRRVTLIIRNREGNPTLLERTEKIVQ